LSPAQAERQGRAVRMAIETLGSERALAFLNGFDPTLQGRPIDFAVESAQGLAALEALLAVPRIP
jgi:hypothetical protein